MIIVFLNPECSVFHIIFNKTFLAMFDFDRVSRGGIVGERGAKDYEGMCAEAYRDAVP